MIPNNLLKAKLQVSNQWGKTILLHMGEACIDDSLGHWLLLSNQTTKEVTNLVKYTLHLLHTTIRVSRLVHKRTDSARDLLSCFVR